MVTNAADRVRLGGVVGIEGDDQDTRALSVEVLRVGVLQLEQAWG
jgi:hypothetical protein